MAKKGTLSIQFDHVDDTGESPSKKLCESLILSGYTDATISKYIALASGASDQAVSFTDAIGVLLVSDTPFSLRLAGGETLLTNLRAFVVWCDDALDGAAQTSVLLSGNGSSVSNIEAIILEKPA